MRLRLTVTGAEIQPAVTGGLYWAEVLRCGSWDYPGMDGGGFDINEAILDEFVANFAAGEKGPEVLLNVNHDDSQEAGWVKRLTKVGAGDDPEKGAKLWAGFEIVDPEIKDRVEKRKLKYTSSELDFDWVNPEACRTDGDCAPRRVFEGLALTNRPYVKGMQPIVLCEPYIERNSPAKPGCKCGERRHTNNKEGHMPKTVEELEAELATANARLAEQGSNNQLAAQLAEERQRREASDRQLRDLVTKSRLDETKRRVSDLVRSRRITPAIGNRLLARLASPLILGGASTVALSEKVKVRLADDSGDEELDKLDVVGEVLDMLQELPDALSKSDDDVDLEEDDSDDDKKGDDAKLNEAKAAARQRVSKEKVKFHVALAEELKKRGISAAIGGKGKGK